MRVRPRDPRTYTSRIGGATSLGSILIVLRIYGGLDTFTTEDKLKRVHGSDVGMVLIGPAGERLVRFATIVAQKGRSGGRPGMGGPSWVVRT